LYCKEQYVTSLSPSQLFPQINDLLLTINIVQRSSGSCAEALQSRGEGVFELIFEVADLVTEASRLQSRGLLTYPGETSQRAVCFDARTEGNTLIRLVQR